MTPIICLSTVDRAEKNPVSYQKRGWTFKCHHQDYQALLRLTSCQYCFPRSHISSRSVPCVNPSGKALIALSTEIIPIRRLKHPYRNIAFPSPPTDTKFTEFRANVTITAPNYHHHHQNFYRTTTAYRYQITSANVCEGGASFVCDRHRYQLPHHHHR